VLCAEHTGSQTGQPSMLGLPGDRHASRQHPAGARRRGRVGDSPAIQRETTHLASMLCDVWSIAGRHVRPCKRRSRAYLHGDVRRGRSFARGWPAKSCLQQPGPWCVMRMIVRGPPRPCQGCLAKIALRRLVRIQALIASLGCFEASVPFPHGTATAGQRMIFISRIVTCHQRAASMRPWRQRQWTGSSSRIRIQQSGYSCKTGGGLWRRPVTTDNRVKAHTRRAHVVHARSAGIC